jgi:hypothetical protein
MVLVWMAKSNHVWTGENPCESTSPMATVSIYEYSLMTNHVFEHF